MVSTYHWSKPSAIVHGTAGRNGHGLRSMPSRRGVSAFRRTRPILWLGGPKPGASASPASCESTSTPSCVRAVRAAAPVVAQLVEEGERAEQIRRREQEAQWQLFLEQQERERREKARQAARADLLKIIEGWGEAQRIHSFFAAAQEQAYERADGRDDLLARLASARALIGELDPLGALLDWKTPEER